MFFTKSFCMGVCTYCGWFLIVACGVVNGAIIGQGLAINHTPDPSPLTQQYPFSVVINKDISLFWSLEENDIIEMAVLLHQSTGWLAVAIGPYDAGHERSDMIVGVNGQVQDRFSYEKDRPRVDHQYNIISGSMNVTQLQSLMVFTRKLKTTDAFEDREIYTQRTTKIAYAWGDVEGGQIQQHPSGAYGTLFVNFKTGQGYRYSSGLLIPIKFVFVIVFLLICLIFCQFIAPIPVLYKLRKKYYFLNYFKYSIFDMLMILLLIGMNVALFYVYHDERIDVGINLAVLSEFTIALVFLTILKSPYFNCVFSVSYERQLKYHRLYGWMAFAVITAHVVGSLIGYGKKGTISGELKLPQNQYGLIAYGILIVLIALTAHIVRRKKWEWFKYSHYLFYAFIIIGALHATNFIYFCLPGLVLYVGDRVYRFIQKYRVKAKIVSVEVRGGNLLILRIESSRKYHPGQFFQLSFPDVALLESHPYSISSSPTEPILTIHAKSLGKWSGKVIHTISPDTKIRLDGPFGIPANWRHEEVVVLFSGGVGATPHISLVRDHILSPKRPRPTHLYFYPAFSSTSDLCWFTETWDLIATDPSVTVQRYVSQEDKLGLELHEMGGVQQPFTRGRPSVNDLLQAVCTANLASQRILVLACGPGSLWRSVQRECYRVSKSTGKKLYFAYEIFKF